MKYFANCRCIEDVKELYRKLCKQFHPDCNPNGEEEFKKISVEYSEIFEKLKNVHRTKDGGTYKAENSTETESPEEYKDIIDTLIHYDVIIDIIGAWIWVSGNTRPIKDTLKGMGFRWSKQKTSWYWHPEGYRKKSKKTFTMSELKNMFDTQTFAGKDDRVYIG